MRLRLFFILMFWALPGLVIAQSSMTASIDPNIVEVGQTLRYEVTIATKSNGDMALTTLPDFGEARVLQRTQSPRFVNINGISTRSISYIWAIQPQTKGRFEIAGVEGKVGDEILRAPPVSYQVVDPGNSPKTTRNEQAWVESEVDPPRQVYVGEQLSLHYHLYLDVRLRDVQPMPPDEPPLDEFWVEDLSSQLNSRQVVSAGSRRVNKIALRSYALFPLRAGRTKIEPLELPLVQSSFFRREEVRIKSEPLEIDVLPLPPGAPSTFYEGNVGEWNLDVSVDTRSAKVGDTVRLRITARGNGLPTKLRLPDFPQIPNLRALDANESHKKEVRNLKIYGEKRVEIPLLLLKEGRVQIPSMTWSFFNPEKATYETLETQPILLSVSPGTLPPSAKAPQEIRESTLSSTSNKAEEMVDELLGQLKPADEAASSQISLADNLVWQLAVALLSLVSLLLLFEPFARRWWGKGEPLRRKKARQKELIAALQTATSWDDLSQIVGDLLVEILETNRATLSPHRIAKALETSESFDSNDAKIIAEVLKVCEEKRFAPDKSTDSTFQRLHSEAKSIFARFAIVMLAFGLVSQEARAETTGGHHQMAIASAEDRDWGKARLEIERAWAQSPWDSATRSNQETIAKIVRLNTIQSTRVGRVLEGHDDQLFWWRAFMSLGENSLPAALLVTLSLLVLLLLIARRRAAVRPFILAPILLFLVIVSLWVAKSWVESSVAPVIIVKDKVEFRSGPTPHASVRGDIKGYSAGTMLRSMEERGDWVKISLGEDSAWTLKSNVEFVSE